GESKTASRSSTQGKTASQRGGEKSGGGGSSGRTKDELYEEAKKRDIHGRSTMTKQQLKNALGR
ncbi:plasmid stabilization protein, partial [Streptomyces hydrogenans]